MEYLIIGGGGGGGYSRGAGGGAGGFRNGTKTLSGSAVTIAVGIGGTAGISTNESGRGGQGANSTLDGLVSDGGGWGGSAASGNPIGGHGASGGGSTDAYAAGTGTAGQGLSGGIGTSSANYGAGGGGGNQTTGGAGSGTNGGNGGNGGQSAITGTVTYYAGGGGGGIYSSGTPGTGGSGGGGAGGLSGAGTDGTDDLGGGGGGGGYSGTAKNGGRGGSGIVIVRWLASDTTPPKSITGLTNTTPSCSNITWTWTNPTDSDYYQLITYKNNVLNGNLSNSTTSTIWNGLTEHTSYTISTKTMDLIGNINSTFVNATVTIDFCPVPNDVTPPKSITGLTNTTPFCSNITWTWTNPTDSDYYQLITYKNNVLNGNLSNSTTSTIWNSLTEFTAYTISTKTMDLIGNLNSTFVNATATTDWCHVEPTPTPTPTPTPELFAPEPPGNLCDLLEKYLGYDCT